MTAPATSLPNDPSSVLRVPAALPGSPCQPGGNRRGTPRRTSLEPLVDSRVYLLARDALDFVHSTDHPRWVTLREDSHPRRGIFLLVSASRHVSDDSSYGLLSFHTSVTLSTHTITTTAFCQHRLTNIACLLIINHWLGTADFAIWHPVLGIACLMPGI